MNTEKTAVMVRAYCNVAAIQWLKTTYGDKVELYSAKGGDAIRVPRRDVYLYDKNLSEQIAKAVDAGDVALAEQLWSRASAFEGAAT